MEGWFAQNWFSVFSTVTVLVGLWYTNDSLREDIKTRRIANLLTLTQNHRELWSQMLAYPQLERILDETVDLEQDPITVKERIFVSEVIQHVNSAYETMKSGLVIRPEGVAQDIKGFFTLPIPKAIWDKAKDLQNKDLVKFVENSIKPTI